MRNLDRSCELNEHDLLAYADGELRGARLEYVDAHLRVCASCQAWLKEFEHLRHLFQTSTRVSADPVRRASLLADLSRGTNLRRQPWLPPRLAIVGLLAALLLAIGFPTASDADTLLGDFVRIGIVRVKERFDDPLPLAVPTADAPLGAVGVAFPAVEPTTLPLGYEVVARESPSPDLLRLYLQNDEGVALLLSQEPAQEANVTVSPNAPTEIVTIRGTAVLLLGDPRPDMVSAFFWERGGVGFGVLVVDEPSGGFPRQDALLVAEAVIATQDDE